MGRSQLQYNRRARGRGGRGGAGRDGAVGGGGGGAPSGRGPAGRAAAAKASEQAALRKLPSNQYRFQRGSGGEATGGGPRRGGGDDEGDDLRAYALSTDSRLGHRYVLAEGASGEEEAEEELVKDLPSLSLDLLGLAQGLCCLPAYVRMGNLDPALTEGLEYRQGASSSGNSRAKPIIDKQQEKTTVSPPVAPPPKPPPPPSPPSRPLESTLEKLDISGSPDEGGAKDVLSDLDSLLALGGGGGPLGAGTGGVMAMDEDLLDDLLGSSAAAAAAPPPPPPASSTTTKPSGGGGGGGGGRKKLSSLDAGDY